MCNKVSKCPLIINLGLNLQLNALLTCVGNCTVRYCSPELVFAETIPFRQEGFPMRAGRFSSKRKELCLTILLFAAVVAACNLSQIAVVFAATAPNARKQAQQPSTS